MKCQICLRKFSTLRFTTQHINICRFCVQDLNEYREVGESVIDMFAARLRKGIETRLIKEMAEKSNPSLQRKAMRDYNQLDDVVKEELPSWLNKMASENSTHKDYRILRACRHGLIRIKRPQKFGFPSNWMKKARAIRERDERKCVDCKSTAIDHDVHHIIYRSNFGTDRKANLVSLCRKCHEKLHGRSFDTYENPAAFPDEMEEDLLEEEKVYVMFSRSTVETVHQPIVIKDPEPIRENHTKSAFTPNPQTSQKLKQASINNSSSHPFHSQTDYSIYFRLGRKLGRIVRILRNTFL